MRTHGNRIRVIVGVLLTTMSLAINGMAWTAQSPHYQLLADSVIAGGQRTDGLAQRLYRSVIGEAVGGDASSGTRKLSSGIFTTQDHLNLLLPHRAPTFNPFTTPTAVSPQTLTGTKVSDTSLWLNGAQIIPLNANTTWSYTASLVHGTNVLNLLTKDLNGNASATITIGITLDQTPPTMPVVTDDGAFTATFTQLHTTWTSSDPETGIQEYEYRIGTTPTGSELLAATSIGTATSVTKTGLMLVQGRRYYLAVRAKNAVGLWSEWGISDGIYANSTVPAINSFSPADGQKFFHGTTVTWSSSASDADGDALEYQFSSNGLIKRAWSALNTDNWLTTTSDIGLQRITVEIRDGHGGAAEREQEIYGLRKPVSPP